MAALILEDPEPVNVKELLLNSRDGWTKRPHTEPKSDFYNTNTGSKMSIAKRLKKTPQRYAILRSGAPRFGKNSVQMRDGGHLQTDRTSIQYSVSKSSIRYSTLKKGGDRFAIKKHSDKLLVPHDFRRSEAQEHGALPRTAVVEQVLFRNEATNVNHAKSIAQWVKTTPNKYTAVQKSAAQRVPDLDSLKSVAHLGPGTYDPLHPDDPEIRRLAEARARNMPRKLRKPQKQRLSSEVSITGQSAAQLEQTAHLGPGAYFASDTERDAAAVKKSGVKWGAQPRWVAPPKADSYKNNFSALNPRRAWTQWVLPGNPVTTTGPPKPRDTTYGRGLPQGADYLPLLDGGSKTSLATKVARSGNPVAHVFRSTQPRLAEPGSVTAASRREFCPGTGPNVGPGAYNARPVPKREPAPFRTGKQRGDTRTWSDHFNGLRPRHLLHATNCTLLWDT